MRVQLINAPNDVTVHSSGSASFYPHLGLLAIATATKEKFPNVAIEVIDGSITPIEVILPKINADIVGVSVLTPTYRSALRIADAAKTAGAVTVFGNDHATNLWHEILRNRPQVDYVIVGDSGETSFVQFVEAAAGDRAFSSVDNLAYRLPGGSPHLVKPRRAGGYLDPKGRLGTSIEATPIPDRSLIAEETVYFRNYHAAYGDFHPAPVRQTTINIAKGCAWGASDSRRCTFCDIYDLTQRSVSPERAWREIAELHSLGYNFLYEVCDSFSSFAVGKDSFVSRLIESRPSGAPQVGWFVYARASELLKPGVVERLKELGVVRVNVGLDSADDAVLRGMSKGASSTGNRRAVELCAEAGLQMYISLVFGCLGETEESLGTTIRFVEEALSRHPGIVSIDPSVLLPLPNSPAWRYLMAPSPEEPDFVTLSRNTGANLNPGRAFLGKDTLDTEALAKVWVQSFCQCSYEAILQARDEIVGLQEQYDFVFGGFGVRGF